jgi:hypothetical protein
MEFGAQREQTKLNSTRTARKSVLSIKNKSVMWPCDYDQEGNTKSPKGTEIGLQRF